jgi:hypothetical protein
LNKAAGGFKTIMRKSIITLSFLLLGSKALLSQESNNLHKNYIEIGYTGGTYSNLGGIFGVYGAAGFFFKSFGKMSALDFRAKEAYITYPERTAGSITVTYRLFLNKGFYVGAGFAHNHEIAINDYLDDIVGATMGNNKWIIHRSGVTAELGYSFKSFFKKGWLGVYPILGLNAVYLPGDGEPNPFITATAGFRFGFKRMEVPAEK